MRILFGHRGGAADPRQRAPIREGLERIERRAGIHAYECANVPTGLASADVQLD